MSASSLVRPRDLTLLIVAFAAARGSIGYSSKDGWVYISVPGVKPTLEYQLTPKGMFGAVCDAPPSPTFLLMDGGHGRGIRSFTVAVGKNKRTFDVPAGDNARDRALVMLPGGKSGSAEEAADQQAIDTMLAGATSPIVFTTGDGWTRSIPPSPAIGKFIATCRDYLRSHPHQG